VALLDAPVLGRIVGKGLVRIRYIGRRSGNRVELPVGYRRTGSGIVIGVAAPDTKTWWRNFLGDGGPVEVLGLEGRDYLAHAVAHCDAHGGVWVTVVLRTAERSPISA
jgi:hypothetical protein